MRLRDDGLQRFDESRSCETEFVAMQARKPFEKPFAARGEPQKNFPAVSGAALAADPSGAS